MIKRFPRYPVGYGRPPLHSRFKTGTSGNPTGARRPPKPLAEVLQEAFDRRAAGSGRGRRRPTRLEIIIGGLVEQSAGGDLRATKLLVDLVLKIRLPLFAEYSEAAEDPREILKRAMDRLAARIGEGAGGAEASEGEGAGGAEAREGEGAGAP